MNREKTVEVIENMIAIHKRVHIFRSSASLAYSLMLSIFPMLICLYTMLGNLFPTDYAIRSFIAGFLPMDSVGELIVDYLSYVSLNNSHAMLMMAIVAMATTSATAFRTIDNVMDEMRGYRRYTGSFAFAFSFVFSLVFLAAIYFAAIIILTGNWFLSYVDSYVRYVDISASWNWVRFLLLFLLLFVILLGVYRITALGGRQVRLLPGAALASLSFLVVSILFSWFIGMSARYPVVYGSLASVMIMLLWLYICGIVLFAGNMLNVSLEMTKR